MQHLEDAIAAMEVKLDGNELHSLAGPYTPHGVLGHS
jgi:hypothetical protein